MFIRDTRWSHFSCILGAASILSRGYLDGEPKKKKINARTSIDLSTFSLVRQRAREKRNSRHALEIP